MFLKRRDIVVFSKNKNKKYMVCVSKKNKVSLITKEGELYFLGKNKVKDPFKIEISELNIQEDFSVIGNGIKFFL